MMVKNLLHYFILAYYTSHNLKSKLLYGDWLLEVLYFFNVIPDSGTVFRDTVGCGVPRFHVQGSTSLLFAHYLHRRTAHAQQDVRLVATLNDMFSWLSTWLLLIHTRVSTIRSSAQLLMVVYTTWRRWVPLTASPQLWHRCSRRQQHPPKGRATKILTWHVDSPSGHATLTMPSWMTDANGGTTINHDNDKHHHHHCTTTSHTPH